MNSSRTAKEVKKGSTSPMKTPEKSRLPRNSPVVKKPMIRSKLGTMPKKMNHTKSLSQIAYLEIVKQTSVNLVDGFEKIRRLAAFSKLSPVFELIKSLYRKQLNQLDQFVRLKSLLKAWEGFRTNRMISKNKEIIEILNDVGDKEAECVAYSFWKKKRLEKGINGLMKFYCSSFELAQLFDEFYEKKLKRKAFEVVYLNSKYDEVVEDFLKVFFI